MGMRRRSKLTSTLDGDRNGERTQSGGLKGRDLEVPQRNGKQATSRGSVAVKPAGEDDPFP
jgi:hypothetical protein